MSSNRVLAQLYLDILGIKYVFLININIKQLKLSKSDHDLTLLGI